MTLTMPETEIRLPELTFTGGLAGFPDCKRYALVEVEGSPLLLRLCSLDLAGLEFIVVPPAAFFPHYAPELDDAWATKLGLTEPGDALLLVVLTLGSTVEQATANLMAPIVISRRNGSAAQVVLQEEWPLRAPLGG